MPDRVSAAIAMAVHRLAFEYLELADVPSESLAELQDILDLVVRIKDALQLPVGVMVGTLVCAQYLIRARGMHWHQSLVLGAGIACKMLFDEAVYLEDLLLVTQQYSINHLREMEAVCTLRNSALPFIDGPQIHAFRAGLLIVLMQESVLLPNLLGGSLAASAGIRSALVVMIVETNAAERKALVRMTRDAAPNAEVLACASVAQVRFHMLESHFPDLVIAEPYLGKGSPPHLSTLLSTVDARAGDESGFDAVEVVLGASIPIDVGRPLVAAVTRCAGVPAQPLPCGKSRGVDHFFRKPLSGNDLRCLLDLCW